MRLIVLLLTSFIFNGITAQRDSSLTTQHDTIKKIHRPTISAYDATVLAQQKAIELKQRAIGDSIAMQFIKRPDSLRHNQFLDSLLKQTAFNPYLFNQHISNKNRPQMGNERHSRDPWIIAVIFGLLIYTGIINLVFGKDIQSIIQAFYNKRALSKISKEDSLLTSWAFICLFSLFGLTIGLYIYLVILYYDNTYAVSGFELFIFLSVIVISLFVIKILVLRIIGFIFDINRIVSEYITILYLTYFNITFIFLPVVICFSLISAALIPYLLLISLVLILLIFAIQYLRSTLNIISHFSFHKIYLFIYLCALEICPILIIIKALNL